MEITEIKYYNSRLKRDWIADIDLSGNAEFNALSLRYKLGWIALDEKINPDKLSFNDEWNYLKQFIYEENRERKRLFVIREKTLLDIGNGCNSNDVSVLKGLLSEANRIRDIYYSKDMDKKEKVVSNNLGEELWFENFEVLNFEQRIERMDSLINTIDTKIKYLQFKEEPQPEKEINEFIPDKTAIDGLYKFNSKDNDYMYKYLDELNDTFLINEGCSKQTFGEICFILYERKVFSKIKKFSKLVVLLARYWKIEPPKDRHPNKYRLKAGELKHDHNILERDLI